jgi:hypothetical protein
MPDEAATPHLVAVDGPADALPGLDELTPAQLGRITPLERAVRHTLAQLDESGALTELDAGRIALAVEMAQIISEKRQTRRTSTVGNDARVLMEILDELAPAAASESDRTLRHTLDEWSATIAAHEAAERERATNERGT